MSNAVPVRYYKTEYRRENIDVDKYPYGERSEIIPNMHAGVKLIFANAVFRITDIEFDLSERLSYVMIVWMKEITR
jgi:hypothetical protein